jgi:hypothetical protein
MLGVAKETVLRIIEETGDALSDYMSREFRDLPCKRIELDEQWQYVGKHGQRMQKKEPARGDFWLWAAVDPDTKLVFSHLVARRNWQASEDFVCDVSERVRRPVQIATDNHRSYAMHIRAFFGYEGVNYGTETKIFGEPGRFEPRRENARASGWNRRTPLDFSRCRRNDRPLLAAETRSAEASHGAREAKRRRCRFSGGSKFHRGKLDHYPQILYDIYCMMLYFRRCDPSGPWLNQLKRRAPLQRTIRPVAVY